MVEAAATTDVVAYSEAITAAQLSSFFFFSLAAAVTALASLAQAVVAIMVAVVIEIEIATVIAVVAANCKRTFSFHKWGQDISCPTQF